MLPVVLDKEAWASNIRSAGKNAAAGFAGDPNEDYKILLGDEYAIDLLAEAAQRLDRCAIFLLRARITEIHGVHALTQSQYLEIKTI